MFKYSKPSLSKAPTLGQLHIVQSIGATKPVDRSLCDKITNIGTNDH